MKGPRPSFVVISGGTGGNAVCSAFHSTTSYVLPVSDDGGSSSEIIRVLGGPSIGMCFMLPFTVIANKRDTLTRRRYPLATGATDPSRTAGLAFGCYPNIAFVSTACALF
jgi:2-phospho-L-lactate transferase CofD